MPYMPSGNRAEILEHLGYEWWMFRSAHALLSEHGEEGDPVRNALVESLAIHGRNLAYFFHEKKRRGKDDWNAEDLGLPLVEPMPQALKDWCVEAHKRIAHLTATRMIALDSWKPGTIRPHLVERIAAVKRHVGEDMPTNWIGEQALSKGSRTLRPRTTNSTLATVYTYPDPNAAPTRIEAGEGSAGSRLGAADAARGFLARWLQAPREIFRFIGQIRRF